MTYLFALMMIGWAVSEAHAQSRPFQTEKRSVTVETVANGLENPWGLAFLPDGRMLVTERPGRMRIVAPDGALSAPLTGVPNVSARNQGGLLDVVLDPAFAANRFIYVTFAEPRSGGSGTSVARLRMNAGGAGFDQASVIFRQEPAYNGGLHFGSRLVFDRTGALFVALGDRYALRNEAQNPANTLGKIVRIATDGSIPPGNPGREGWLPAIWSIGHRNIQGAALHPVTGRLWTAEHGARGGDEINIPEAGKNYGWPVITYGRDYSGAKIGEGTHKPGMEQPIFYWDPSIAPSGMAFYTGDRFPEWKGNAFIGALAGQMVARLTLDGEKVVAEERLFVGMNKRIRDVRQGPDGFLYLLVDAADGEVLRVR
ncbi:MAG: PQQ-dependent sugar dehydrogenase [Methylocystis sp.]|nr:PQQ-dependent sugar dehydrogenase [Methylocystis sp.]MCA3589230.1 PQQ-dependent sugar dehydrogenase [Methylocystis sp.]MCA3593518.1 PQQ-dependent sugar dehydrogenase [Methylocystis sp.]